MRIKNFTEKRVNICAFGCRCLEIFWTIAVISIVGLFLGIVPAIVHPKEVLGIWLLWGVTAFLVEYALFWVGIVMVYLTSLQLGIKWRILGIALGPVPILHVIMLYFIIRTVREEIRFERYRIDLNKKRSREKICETKYPIVLVHGVFFRDRNILNYWGRIPEELEKNGAAIFYGKQKSAAPVEESARELERRILEILEETGSEKVNLIAHSKGGLDARAAISMTGIGDKVASLTTVNTPHRGCLFADYLLGKFSEEKKLAVAQFYNASASKLGDVEPDFLAAVYDLTSERCRIMNETVLDDPNVFYQSVGSRLNRGGNGQFPLNLSYHFVKHFDGENDGLVGVDSFAWGQEFHMIRVNGRRGVSHGDVIDLNRENFEGFDVREFYVQLVSNLRERGF